MSNSTVKTKNYFDISDYQKIFIPIKENSKKPICKYNKLEITPYDDFISNENCNTAILTGYINNIIVIDVDSYKESGLIKWENILQKINYI